MENTVLFGFSLEQLKKLVAEMGELEAAYLIWDENCLTPWDMTREQVLEEICDLLGLQD